MINPKQKVSVGEGAPWSRFSRGVPLEGSQDAQAPLPPSDTGYGMSGTDDPEVFEPPPPPRRDTVTYHPFQVVPISSTKVVMVKGRVNYWAVDRNDKNIEVSGIANEIDLPDIPYDGSNLLTATTFTIRSSPTYIRLLADKVISGTNISFAPADAEGDYAPGVVNLLY